MICMDSQPQITKRRREMDQEHIVFHPEDLKGSKLLCSLLTHGTRDEVAGRLSRLIGPIGRIDPSHNWMPDGFVDREEAQLHRARRLFNRGSDGRSLGDWWLMNKRGARTPTWDLSSQCVIGETTGLTLGEAKAHVSELLTDSPCGASEPNRSRIIAAIAEANAGLAAAFPGRWNLSHERRYQMSNRFAWAWKLATLGIPVALVYLGFVNACDWPDRFNSRAAWEEAVLDYSEPLCPPEVWGSVILVNGTPIYPILRSVELSWSIG